MKDAQFDAKAEALHVENLAQQFHDAIVQFRILPIEGKQTLDQVTQAFGAEMSTLWKDPAKMHAVGLEIEKINNSGNPDLSSLPKATIKVDSSEKITELDFPPVDSGGVMLRLISTAEKPYEIHS